MALLDRLTFWRKSDAMSDGYGVFVDLLRRSLSTKAGVSVTREKALGVATVLACARVLADGVAQVPWRVMRKQQSTVSVYPQRLEADEHAYHDVLKTQPNSWQSSYEFRETLVFHMLFGRHGAFAYKNTVRVMGQDYHELILLDPSRVEVEQDEDWVITYKVRGKDGAQKTFTQDRIWHVRGPSWDGFRSMDLIQLTREAIGLAAVLEDSQARMHVNGVKPSQTYSIEGTLTEAQQKQLTAWIKAQAAAENTGNPLILDRSAKLIASGWSSVDAQLLESRRYQVEEICRGMRVMPIMIGYSDKTTTFASAEAMFLAHKVHTLTPLYRRIQQSADVQLLTRDDRRKGYYTHLDPAGLLMGDLRATAEHLTRLTLGGIMVRNEARAKLDLNPLEGLDEPLTPTNMTNDPSGAPAGSKPEDGVQT